MSIHCNQKENGNDEKIPDEHKLQMQRKKLHQIKLEKKFLLSKLHEPETKVESQREREKERGVKATRKEK